MIGFSNDRYLAGKTMRSRALAILGAALLASACASTPEATRERDAEAKRFEAVTRDAVVYVYRPESTMSGPETTLWIDNRLVGSSLPGSYFRVIVFPGRNVIETSPPDTGRIELATAASEIVYVEMRSEGGTDGSPSSRFRVVPAERAQAAIKACCRLLELWRHDQPRLLW